MTKAMANTYPVKGGNIGLQHPAVSALMLGFSILLLGFPPVLLFMNAHSLKGLPFILLSLIYVVSICTAYAFIVLNSQASKLKREIGKKALAELYPSLNRFEERKAAFLSTFGISPDWDYVPKSERKAFFVNTGYGVVKMRKIKVKRPVLITLELGLATVAVGIIPTLITINAQKLGWWFTILWAAFFALLVCIYVAICLPEVWRKEKFIFGDEMFYSSHPRLKMLKERREQRALRIAEKAIMPKAERKAFFVYTGYGTVKLGKIKAGIPVLQAILVAIPMVIGIVVITPLIFCIEGPLFIVAVCGYLLFLFGVNIAVRLPSILRKEKELLGDEFYYFHPVLKRIKERKERIAARAAEKAIMPKAERSAFFVNTGCGAVKLGKIKVALPVLIAVLIAIPMAVGIVVMVPLIFCIEGPLFIAALCGYLLFLAGVGIAVCLPEILRREKEQLGDEFYYFHPRLKKLKNAKSALRHALRKGDRNEQ